MLRPTLYLMLGYPGSGKTTTAKLIHELTGAVHLWADKVRRERFKQPTHTHSENLELYAHLNEVTAELLRAGNSVVFDTNFNFYNDREHLSQIAKQHGAKAVVVWVKTAAEVARDRATKDADKQHTRILGNMPLERWERIRTNLQPPRPDEAVIEVDGTKVSKDYIAALLKNAARN